MAINSKVTQSIKDDGGYIEEKEETPAVGEGDLQDALAEVDETYDGVIDQVDSFYQEQIGASKQWSQTQQQNQQAQTDFTIEQIEQQKQQAQKDYLKEQSGAYVDWQKQSGQYGVNAEAMAAQGMGGTGYSESAQVSMYNTYQNRVAAARESLARATLNYDNAIKEARLQNSAILAEIAYQAYQQEIELALQGFQYKNQLVLEKADRKAAVEQEQFDRWLKVMQLLQEEEEGNSGVPIGRDVDGPMGGNSGNLFGIVADAGTGADAQQYGTFSNGRPKGIKGHGTLSETGDYVTFTTTDLSGEPKMAREAVLVAADGTLWYWSAAGNKYLPFSVTDSGDNPSNVYDGTFSRGSTPSNGKGGGGGAWKAIAQTNK